MKVRFEKKVVDKPIPESFFREPKYSDDEYQPSGHEELSSEDRDSNNPSFQGSTAISTPSPAEDRKSSRPSPGRTLRSGSRPKLPISFTPMNKLVPKAQEWELSPKLPNRPSRFGQGYSKRVRDAFSDTSSSCKSEGDPNEQVHTNTELQSKQDSENDSEDSVITELIHSTKERQWSPRAWMERYETEFMPGRDGSVWFATGPFKGWILDGPRAGGYISGCKEPDDETIAKAEKTAELRWNQRWVDSECEDVSDAEGSNNEAINIGRVTPSNHEDATSTDIQQPLIRASKGKSSHKSSLPSTLRNILGKTSPRVKINDKAVEWAERTERTKQYVLAGGSSDNIYPQQKSSPCKPISSRTRGKFPTHLALTTAPQSAPSPPSAESETTSTLITQQLINDCAPPSNQELAELMSSSPAIRRANTSSQVHKVCEPAESSSSESSSGIPARISPKPPARALEVPRTQVASFGPEHVNAAHILGGIAGRRTTRSLTTTFPPTIESNKIADGVERLSTDSKPDPSSQYGKDSSKTNIVVEVPGLSTKEQREYEVVSSTPDIRSTLSPKSFKEINEATSGTDIESNDPDAEKTLDYVLRQSPRWLTNITEANEPSNMNAFRLSSTLIATPSTQGFLGDTAKPTVQGSDNNEMSEELHPRASKTVAPAPISNTSTTSEKGGNIVGGSSEVKKRRKRKASAPDASLADESHPDKMPKIDGQSRAKTERLTYRQRKRRQRRLRQKQRKYDREQQPVDNEVGKVVGKGVNRSSQSTMTPPASSRPTSSEAKQTTATRGWEGSIDAVD
ncbi:uncharacterized protein GGS22DRAFT_175264 [Annulohypoxylon maeteangense]|uniref:uncharacterized protein n=1 Tax=Annulohypoxylon maeteangense TaxID=1927788 RepID=UPI002007AEEC|nr:uncharacterized protein GGS22DRAFT_175264 [Annulohypoxylon maeteangense]KAI0880295.1 hypothetical protein GGS22DRAFT_175264 [Annulohypoxylon maeteangense]